MSQRTPVAPRYYAACRACEEEWEARGGDAVATARRSVDEHVETSGHTVAEQDQTWIDVTRTPRANDREDRA